MNAPGDADVVLLRHREIGVKSGGVQSRMEERLRSNLEKLLESRGVDADVDRRWSRVYVREHDDVEAAVAAASDCFGVASASACTSTQPEMDAMVEAAVAAAREGGVSPGESFAVDARRAGDRDAHPFTSEEIEEEAGAAVAEETGASVDLDDPDVSVGVECRSEEAYVYLDSVDGPGGLPLGSQEPVAALVSGGIDSPVAAWQMMKRGSPVVPVYLDLGSYGGADHVARVHEALSTLARYVPEGELRLHRVPVEDVVEALMEETSHTRMLHYRRFMYRVAEEVAERGGLAGVVTGESLGQKSSQTAANLRAVDAAATLPVHRPLLTWDKQEIVDLAREIGTYESAKVDAGCVSLAPSKPATAARLDEVLEREPEGLLERASDCVDDLTVETVEPGEMAEEPRRGRGDA